MSGPFDVTFRKDAKEASFKIPINDELLVEGREDFLLMIYTTLPTGLYLCDPNATTVRIRDDDCK